MQGYTNAGQHAGRDMTISVGGFVPPTRYAAGTKPAARLAGAYFITLVTFQRDSLFGEIRNGKMKLNRHGMIVQEEWFASADIRKEIRLYPEEFVVMPNHIHGIVWIVDTTGADGRVGENSVDNVGATGRSPLQKPTRQPGPAKKSLSSFVAGFKSAVTKRIRNELNETGIWQRNYHDRIIRDEPELENIRKYIEINPSNWEQDEENKIP
jgi:REP element-mobilizing transposase RayT